MKKKTPFPSWVDGEGKDRGQFILLSDSLSSSWCPRGGGRTIFWKSVQKGCPVPSGVPSSALCSVRGASSQEQGCLSLCGSEEVSRAPSGRELLLHLTVAAACPSEGRLVGRGVWFSPGRPRKPNIMRAIWTCILKPGSSPLPHSHPCFVFSPCHQILR